MTQGMELFPRNTRLMILRAGSASSPPPRFCCGAMPRSHCDLRRDVEEIAGLSIVQQVARSEQSIGIALLRGRAAPTASCAKASSVRNDSCLMSCWRRRDRNRAEKTVRGPLHNAPRLRMADPALVPPHSAHGGRCRPWLRGRRGLGAVSIAADVTRNILAAECRVGPIETVKRYTHALRYHAHYVQLHRPFRPAGYAFAVLIALPMDLLNRRRISRRTRRSAHSRQYPRRRTVHQSIVRRRGRSNRADRQFSRLST